MLPSIKCGLLMDVQLLFSSVGNYIYFSSFFFLFSHSTKHQSTFLFHTDLMVRKMFFINYFSHSRKLGFQKLFQPNNSVYLCIPRLNRLYSLVFIHSFWKFILKFVLGSHIRKCVVIVYSLKFIFHSNCRFAVLHSISSFKLVLILKKRLN